jgi:pimeloyl-ACP methyl ester carboxylesterase
MHYPDLAPAFQLVREGYDVWLGNQRGTTYSTGHTTLDVKSKEYWSFSFTEMGEYDAPAQIEYALNVAGQKKAAAFIGHSQGTSQMFYALSAHPDYWKQKIGLYVALAPVTSLHDTPSGLLKIASDFSSEIVSASNLLHVYVFLQDGLASFVTGQFCKLLPSFCNALQFFVTSTDITLDD